MVPSGGRLEFILCRAQLAHFRFAFGAHKRIAALLVADCRGNGRLAIGALIFRPLELVGHALQCGRMALGGDGKLEIGHRVLVSAIYFLSWVIEELIVDYMSYYMVHYQSLISCVSYAGASLPIVESRSKLLRETGASPAFSREGGGG